MKMIWQSKKLVHGYNYEYVTVFNSVKKRNYLNGKIDGFDCDVGGEIVSHLFYYTLGTVDGFRFVHYPLEKSNHFIFFL